LPLRIYNTAKLDFLYENVVMISVSSTVLVKNHSSTTLVLSYTDAKLLMGHGNGNGSVRSN